MLSRFSMKDQFKTLCQALAGITVFFYGYAFQKTLIPLGRVTIGNQTAALPQGYSLLLTAFMMLFIAFLSRKISHRTLVCGCIATGGALLGISLVLIALCYLTEMPFEMEFISICSLLQPTGAFLLIIPWVSLYASLTPVTVAFLNATASLIAAVLSYLTDEAPYDRVFAAIVLFSILSVSFCLIASRSLSAHGNNAEEIMRKPQRAALPLKAMAFIGSYSFAYGIASVTLHPETMRYASVIPAAIIMVLVFFNIKRFNIVTLYRLAFPLLIGGFLLVSFLPGVMHSVSSVILDAGDTCVTMLVMLMACTISYSTGISVVWVFGIFVAIQFFCQYTGLTLADAAAGIGGAFPSILSIVAVFIAVGASFALISEKNLFSFWSASHGESDDREDDTMLKLRCLSVNYGLTERELEVVTLAYEGKSNMQIARDMFISEGTVKVHFHHVYQKLGIHSRKELLSLIQDKPGDSYVRGTR